MGLVCSGCYCDQHIGRGGKCHAWDNLKCKLINAAQRRHAKKACRCIRRRPKCLRFRRKWDFQCKCNHESCRLGLNQPPIPLGCGPPLKPVCNSGSHSPNLLRSGIPRPSLTTSPRLPPCVRFPGEIPPCAKAPCIRDGKDAPCGKDPPCREPQCLRTRSPVTCRGQSPNQKAVSKRINTESPKSVRSVSKTVNTDVITPIGRSRSPMKKEGKKLATRSRSLSPEPPDDEPVYVCCGGGGHSPDRKNVCRFTVDAYFT